MKKTRPRSGSTNRSHKEPRRLMNIPNSNHPKPKKISNLNLGNLGFRSAGIFLAFGILCSLPARAELPAYQPQEKITGTLRTWGHVFVKDVMRNWETGFVKFHPEVRFEDNLVS